MLSQAVNQAAELPPVEVCASKQSQGPAERYLVYPPVWGAWLTLMDLAESPDGDRQGLEVDRILRGWLRSTVRLSDAAGRERSLARRELDALPVALSDELAQTGVELMERQRQILGLDAEAFDSGWRMSVGDDELELVPWTLGTRNAELRRCLALDSGGELTLDLGAFERAAMCRCANWRLADGSLGPVTQTEVSQWPVPLGEEASARLEALNDPAAEEGDVLAACARAGQEHPDLAVAELCLGYGWTSSDVAALPACDAQRALAALRVLRGAAPRAADPAQSTALEAVQDGLTTILVRDD
ncbi:MAG: hypothetical protein AAF560_29920 [Acidobacteriota bacterium]